MNADRGPASTSNAHTIPPAEIERILRLRLLIARAATRDSLAWWDDDSLTGPSAYLLNRIFPVAPDLAARSLALRAAFARHEAACAMEPNALHLFHLDAANRDELAVRRVDLESLSVAMEPISSVDALRTHLLELTGEPSVYKRVRLNANQAMLVEISAPPAGVSIWRHRAQALAWAYLEGRGGQPVFPFVLE